MPFCPSCGKEVQIGAAFCPYCGRNLKETLKPARISRPTGVTILGILQIIGSVIVLFVGLVFAGFLGPIGIIAILFAILPLIFSIALFTGRNWARILMLIGAVLDILSIIGIIWGVILLWYLTRPRVVAYFKQPKLSEEKPLGKIVASTPSKKSHLLRNIIIAVIVIVVVGGIAGYLSTKGDLFPTQHRINIVSGSTIVREVFYYSNPDGHTYESCKFTVPTGATNIHVIGNFTAYGGSGDDIRVSVVDGYRPWSTTSWAFTKSYYYSGTVHTAQFDVQLPAGGIYHIVLDNGFSTFSLKRVYIQADLVYTSKGSLALG